MAPFDVTRELYSFEGCQDPHAVYAELLGGPAVIDTDIGWLAVHHDAVVAALRHPNLGHVQATPVPDEPLEQRIGRAMFIKRNPPEHTFLRGLVAKAFTPRTVRDLRAGTVAIVDRLIDQMADGGHGGDLLAGLAAPLPVAVIANMFGVPEPDRDAFRHWSEDLVTPQGHVSPEVQTRADRAGREFAAYLVDLVRDRRARPSDDLVGQLVAASDANPAFSEDDVVATCELLLFAGHETTVNLIGNGMLTLLTHPSERNRLADEPSLIGPAVEELLRYDGPVHLTARAALGPVEIAGVAVEPGEVVTILFGSANRDPRRFERADAVDVTRAQNPHVGFGFGIHFCLGAPLARMEAQIAIPRLLARFPNLELAADTMKWRHSLMLRGLTALPVSW